MPGCVPAMMRGSRVREEPAIPAITIPGGATAPELSAHLAVPPVGEGPWPGVVVLHESFGLIDDIREQADRLAAAGYLAGAPGLHTGGGAPRRLPGAVPPPGGGHRP